jgi:hypothetical protein
VDRLDAPALGKIYAILEAPRRVGQIGGDILPAQAYRNKEERWSELLLGSVLFRLVAPPL